jgi:hypothetical protein
MPSAPDRAVGPSGGDWRGRRSAVRHCPRFFLVGTRARLSLPSTELEDRCDPRPSPSPMRRVGGPIRLPPSVPEQSPDGAAPSCARSRIDGQTPMRNPFVPPGAVSHDRLIFIVATRGGNAWLWAGGLFWAAAGLCGLLGTADLWPKVYLYGGFSAAWTVQRDAPHAVQLYAPAAVPASPAREDSAPPPRIPTTLP